MTRAIAIGLICLVSVIFAFTLQAAPGQETDNYLPFIVGAATGPLTLSLDPIVDAGVLERPVDIANAGDERLFVVERAGTIRIVQPDGTVQPQPFLDIRDRVEWESHGERGLLGLAFPPDSSGFFFVNYTARPDGDTRISRFSVSSAPDLALAGSEEIILTVDQPYPNHNGGDLDFGPDDGYLYVAMGDGGSGNDPGNRAQATDELLGKLLRLDVGNRPANALADCGDGPYRVPADNPLADGQGGACDEIWALGLRNPWRFSFDAQTHELFIGDVGQGAWEEVNVQPLAGGENYGWSCYEGTHPNPNTNMPGCSPAGAYIPPVFEYSHGEGCSVTGGFVYRGQRYPALIGHYIFTDYCSGLFWDMSRDGSGQWSVTRHDNLQATGFSTFGEGADGELYVANVVTGALYHIVITNSGP
jgi:glucose/arabinose dehydrogenase